MDFSLFRDLERLSRTGNFSQAAAQGNLSQPAFSRRIRALEAWAGATLVDRSRQPVRLTGAGAQMLEAGLQALDRVEQERSQILQAQSLPDKYVVSFAAQHSIGWRFYPTWLQSFEAAYGPILSRLRADDLPVCLQDLKRGDVDFVIAYCSPGERPGDADSVRIGQDRLIPVCKPDARGRPLYRFDRSDAQMPFLQFGDKAPIARHLDPLFARAQIRRRLKTVYENSMAGALRIRARDGSGVAWLPESLVVPDLSAGILVQTGAADWTVSLDIRLLRESTQANAVTAKIWRYLSTREYPALLEPAI